MPIKRSDQARKLASVKKRTSATKQAEQNGVPSPLNGVVAPVDKRFGQPEGNPRHNGAWRKEDTLRYKLQQVAKLDKDELSALIDDKNAGEYERSVARILLDVAEPQNQLTAEERWRILNGLTNQDSGMPKQQVDQTNYEAPIPLSPRELITEPIAATEVVEASARSVKSAQPAKKKATKKKTAKRKKK